MGNIKKRNQKEIEILKYLKENEDSQLLFYNKHTLTTMVIYYKFRSYFTQAFDCHLLPEIIPDGYLLDVLMVHYPQIIKGGEYKNNNGETIKVSDVIEKT